MDRSPDVSTNVSAVGHRNIVKETERVISDLVSYRFVKLSKVRQWTSFKRCQDLQDEEYELRLNRGDISTTEQHLYFISHRWITPEHPDPDGTQLRRVQALRDEEALLFYDYCALTQRPRDEIQQFLFPRLVMELNDLIPKVKVIVLEDAEYMTRSWCLMEYFISAFHGCLVCDEVRNDRLLELQDIANALFPTKGAKSEFAAFQAARAVEMGQVAHWFFGVFQGSKVTNGKDRQYIDDVLRSFLGQHLGFHEYVPYLGWVTRPLNPDEVERMLRGEKINLLEAREVELPKVDRPRLDVSRSLNGDLGEESYIHRRLNSMIRSVKLNDPNAQL